MKEGEEKYTVRVNAFSKLSSAGEKSHHGPLVIWFPAFTLISTEARKKEQTALTKT